MKSAPLFFAAVAEISSIALRSDSSPVSTSSIVSVLPLLQTAASCLCTTSCKNFKGLILVAAPMPLVAKIARFTGAASLAEPAEAYTEDKVVVTLVVLITGAALA